MSYCFGIHNEPLLSLQLRRTAVQKMLLLGVGAFLKQSAPTNMKFNDSAYYCKISEISTFHAVLPNNSVIRIFLG
jgi:hypothetical protein